MRIDPHPKFRRRRRIALLALVSVFAFTAHMTGGADADIPRCAAWNTAEECQTNNKGENKP